MCKMSEKRICVCEEKDKLHVYIDTIHLTEHELESVDGFYCIACNSFWREP